MGKLSFKSFSILRNLFRIIFNFLSATSTPTTMKHPSIRDFFAPTDEFLEPPFSEHPILSSDYELRSDLITMVRELSFFGLDSEDPYHHLREFELVRSCCAITGMSHDTLRWKLFSFSLKGKAEQWCTSYGDIANGSWDSLKTRFSIVFFQQNEKETLGEAWARFSLLLKSDPTMSTLNPLVLWKFKKSLDKDSADYLNSITGGVPSNIFRLRLIKSLIILPRIPPC